MKYLLIAISCSATLIFAACGSSGGGGGGGVVANVPAPGIAAVAGMNPNNCQIGQIDATSSGYGCLNQESCQSGYGWVPSKSMCVQGTLITQSMYYGTSGSTGRYFGTFSIANQQSFTTLLQYGGLCNPYTVGWNIGSYDCSTYTSEGGFVQIQFMSAGTASTTSLQMYIGAGRPVGPLVPATYQSGLPYIGFTQNGYMTAYNNGAGMLIIATDASGADSVGFRIYINNGQIGQTSPLSGTVRFQGNDIGTVTLTPY